MSTIELLGLLSMAFVAWFTVHEVRRKDQGTGQTRKQAMAEAWMNLMIGFSINFIANYVILPIAGAHGVTATANFWMGWVYTTVSIVRQYAIRRWFNAHLASFAARLAKTSA